VTALLVLVVFFWLRSHFKEHVAEPLETVNRGIEEGWTLLPDYQYTPPKLTELRELVGHYRATQQRLYGYKNEIARLNTAIGYAQKAEENRRQMTSHIAHELKTPLAVIHSYTEALQERIDEEKREQYLAVILSETERMDGMVLEMLDLSRLEALAKIWDSFYRTDKSRTEKGTGLGLPITKAIIELHGGTCQVCNTTFRQENKSVTGVEFKFYLP
jgi:signal transduction histidine kinase